MIEWLRSKKTALGGIALCLIGLVWGVDQLFPGEWFTQQQYNAATAFVTGATAVFMRMGIQKAEDAAREAIGDTK